MTNQTKVFSIIDVHGTTGIALVSDNVDYFIKSGLASSFSNFQIQPPIVSPVYSGGAPTDKNRYTVQVNYYDPSIY